MHLPLKPRKPRRHACSRNDDDQAPYWLAQQYTQAAVEAGDFSEFAPAEKWPQNRKSELMPVPFDVTARHDAADQPSLIEQDRLFALSG
jgi:hypothetical protein